MIDLPQVIAHRGASAYAPENTLASLRKVHEFACRWVECDIQLSRDGQLHVFHDRLLKRTAGVTGRLREYNSSFLRRLDVGSWYSQAYPHEVIPTLKEWLQLAAQLNFSVNIELKSPAASAGVVIAELMRVIKELSLTEKVPCILLSGANKANLKLLYERLPMVPRAAVINIWHKKQLDFLLRTHCVSAHINYKIITDQRIQLIKKHGLKIAAYTVNHKELALSLFERGVDAVFSDYPNLLTL